MQPLWASRFGISGSSSEEILDCLLHHLAAGVGNGLGKRDIFGADLDTILREAALLNAAIAHERLKTFMLERLARGMLVEEPHLRDGGCADKAGMLIELRARLHAAAAGDAARDRIGFFLLRGIH